MLARSCSALVYQFAALILRYLTKQFVALSFPFVPLHVSLCTIAIFLQRVKLTYPGTTEGRNCKDDCKDRVPRSARRFASTSICINARYTPLTVTSTKTPMSAQSRRDSDTRRKKDQARDDQARAFSIISSQIPLDFRISSTVSRIAPLPAWAFTT